MPNDSLLTDDDPLRRVVFAMAVAFAGGGRSVITSSSPIAFSRRETGPPCGLVAIDVRRLTTALAFAGEAHRAQSRLEP